MKQIIITTIFICAFCFITFAQDEKPSKLIDDPIIKFGKVPSGTHRTYLDNFFIEIQNNPGSKGLFVLQFDKKWSRLQKINFIKLSYNHLGFRKMDKTRFAFQIIEGDSEETTHWLIPLGAKFPDTDVKNVFLIKAEDMEKELPKLFKKSAKK